MAMSSVDVPTRYKSTTRSRPCRGSAYDHIWRRQQLRFCRARETSEREREPPRHAASISVRQHRKGRLPAIRAVLGGGVLDLPAGFVFALGGNAFAPGQERGERHKADNERCADAVSECMPGCSRPLARSRMTCDVWHYLLVLRLNLRFPSFVFRKPRRGARGLMGIRSRSMGSYRAPRLG